MKKRFLAILLTVCLLVGLMPVVLAAGGAGTEIDPFIVTSAEEIATALASGGHIKLDDDIAVTETIEIGDNQSVILDLNGHTLSGSVTKGTNYWNPPSSNYIGTITVSGGSLVINDSAAGGGGKVSGAMFAVLVKAGSLVINGGTYCANMVFDNIDIWWFEPLLVGGGTATVNGGAFQDGSVECWSCFNEETCSMTVNGGRFDSFPVYPESGGAAIWAPSGDFMTAYTDFSAFAQENYDTFSYDSTTNTLKLLKSYDATIEETGETGGGIFLNGDVTIDLNGQTWNLSNDNLLLINENVEVTLMDSVGNGEIKNTDQTVIHNMGTLKMMSGNLVLNLEHNSAAGKSAVIVDESGALNMSGGNIAVNVTGSGYAYGVSDTQYTLKDVACTIEISGGSITVNTAEDNTSRNAAVYVYSNRAEAPTYCIISGDAALETNGGGSYCAYYNASNDNPSYIKITGGTFDGALGYNDNYVENVTDAYQITGGEYADDISDFVSKSVIVTDTEDNTSTPFRVDVNTAATPGVVAKIGETRYYKSVEDAISEADGQAVVLLKNASGTVILSSLCSFNIDNNGYQNNLVFQAGEGYMLTKANDLYTIKGDLASGTITANGYYLTYNGQPRTLGSNYVSVRWNGEILSRGTDYTISYENNIDAGSNAVVIATGTGDYTGSVQTTFTINQAYAQLDGTPTIEGWTYGATPNEPSGVTVTKGPADLLYYTYCDTQGGLYTDETPWHAGTWYLRATVPTSKNWRGATKGTVAFEIEKASAPVIPDITIAFNAAAEKEQSILLSGAPEDAGTTTYEISGKIIDDNNIFDGTPTITETGELCFTFAGSLTANTSATIPVKATMQNYKDASFNIIISLNNKKDPDAPDSFEMTFALNDDGETYNAVIPTVGGAEYSFDGVTWGNNRTKTGIKPKTLVTGYIRFPGTENENPSPAVSASMNAPNLQTHKPTADMEGCEFEDKVTVTLSSATERATIYYTTNGTDPSSVNGSMCLSPITISETTTIKAIAWKHGMDYSEILTITFTKKYPIEVSNAEGGNVTVSSESAAAGSEITITTTPDQGYELTGLTVSGSDGSLREVTDAGAGIYTFVMPDSNVTVAAQWSPVSSGGGSTGGSPATYTVATPAAENGTVSVSPKYAISGQTVTITVKPDEGYELDALTVTDSKGTPVTLTDKGDGTYTFKMPASKVSINASFKTSDVEPEPDPVKDCGKDGTCPAAKYTDVDLDSWYHDGIHYCVENGLMNGTGAATFDPEGTTSRAMLVTVLYRLEGEPKAGENSFDDVADGQWYTDAIAWAAENKIVEGYGEGKFGPEDNISREQFATILYRYAKYKGYDVTASADVTSYVDGGDTADWAQEAMSWAVAEKLINGVGNNTLAPQGDAVRAQMATILYRFCENVVK